MFLKLLAHLGLDKTGFDAGIDAAGKKVGKFGADVKGQLAGAFTAAAVIQFTRSVIGAAEEVEDLTSRLGVGVEDAQDFAMAAKLGGVEADFFATKLEKLRTYMGGGGGLELFGIDTKDTIVAIKEMAKLIETNGLTAEQSVKFVEIFGKGAGKMINPLGDLSKAQRAAKFTEADVENAKAVSDAWEWIAKQAKVVSMSVISDLMFRRNAPKRVERDNTNDFTAILAAEQAAEEAEKDRLAWIAIQDRIIDMEKDEKELSEKARVSKMTDQARINELKAKELQLQKEINLEVPVTTDGIFREQYYVMRKNLAKMRAERAGLEGDSLNAITRGFVPPGVGDSDQFQRIGAFTGASAQAAQLDLSRRTLTAMERIRDDLQRRGILVRTDP